MYVNVLYVTFNTYPGYRGYQVHDIVPPSRDTHILTITYFTCKSSLKRTWPGGLALPCPACPPAWFRRQICRICFLRLHFLPEKARTQENTVTVTHQQYFESHHTASLRCLNLSWNDASGDTCNDTNEQDLY
jgi:hypothetical protein